MLRRTAALQDVSHLRSSLSKTMDAIEEETVREKAARAGDLAALQAEVAKVRGFAAGKPGRQLPGRPEGIRLISQALGQVRPQEALYVVALLFNNVKAIIQRFGPDVADELITRIVNERVQPVAPENSAFRWTNSSLVGVFQCPPDLPGLKSRMAELNREPLIHRVELGNRTAVLKLGISHLVAQGSPGAQTSLIAEVDRFTGATA
jgi:GGDEF domain-containing protein